ncbi:aminoglycoside phosphotransferase family protein [Paenibacillus sp. 481]|uniref:aminoglycoside phosphotransferase family protein n=1 Tax=Paenibacillus sp. 481 TaxID=2835869 RepID=UPI001E34C0D8|nr:aminoglycoside phosphotransferase family protein [Paenibacillus sp. 481]UHA73427.1 aminoglycoside phosphotransferase family protein [Paenibacillus sp. 481]
MNPYQLMLKQHYVIEATEVTPQQGGWSALAYKVLCDDQHRYFLKVYEKSRASTPKWTALIDNYVPIIQWLSQQTSLQGKIPVPLLTRNSKYTCEDKRGIYQLFEYIDGTTIGNQPLTNIQIRQLAEIIAELHRYGADISMSTTAIQEDFRLSFAEQLREMLNKDLHSLPREVSELVAPYLDILHKLISNLESISKELQNSELSMRLCHTDLHSWNMMQTDQQLVLIDWEGLKLAPVEADLMFLVDKPYFESFMEIYLQTHHNFVINENALRFYQIRRKLEDVYEFMEQIVYDNQEKQERVDTIRSLKQELAGIEKG